MPLELYKPQVKDHCLGRCCCWPIWDLRWECLPPQSITNFWNKNFLRKKRFPFLCLAKLAFALKMLTLGGFLHLELSVCIMTLLQFCFLTVGTPLVAVIHRWKIPGDVFPVFILVHRGWPQVKIHYLWRSHYLFLNLQKRRWERTQKARVLDTIFPMNILLESFSLS